MLVEGRINKQHLFYFVKHTQKLLTYFASGKGVTADFVMKSGEISMLRIDYTPGEYRIFLQKAHGLPMEKKLKGTYVKVTFQDNVRKVINKIVNTIIPILWIISTRLINTLTAFIKLFFII